MTRPTQTQKRLIYINLLILAGIYTLLFSKTTSPLYDFYSPDSSILMSIGKQIIDGKILYIDCFDSKGPVLFIYQAIAQFLIPGRGGVFLLQIINLFFILIFLYKTSDLITRSFHKNLLIIISFLIYFNITIDQGNQIEEYSITFSIIALYLSFKYYCKTHSLSKREILILSLCFSIVFWIRPNNTGIICAAVLFILITHFKDKKWTFNFDIIHIFLVTFILFSCIVCLYFLKNSTLDALIYAVFSFNIKYIYLQYDYTTLSGIKHIFTNLVVFISLLVGTIFLYKKEKDRNIIFFGILLAIFSFIPVNMRFGAYYFMGLLAPVFSIGLIFLLGSRQTTQNQNKAILAISCVSGILLFSSFFVQWEKYKDFDTEYTTSAKEIVAKVPDKEKDHCFGYQVDAKLFLVTELKPIFKYYFYQEWQGYFDNQIIEKVNEKMRSESTLWIIIQKDLMQNSSNRYVKDLLEAEYNLYFENDHFVLYKRKNFVNQSLIRFIMLSRPSLFVENRK